MVRMSGTVATVSDNGQTRISTRGNFMAKSTSSTIEKTAVSAGAGGGAASSSPAAPMDPNRKRAIDQAVSQIERNFGKGSIMRLDDDPKLVIPGISTGAISLDLALGGRGIPRGRVIEIFGPESSGKTTPGPHRHRSGPEGRRRGGLHRRRTRARSLLVSAHRRGPGGIARQPARHRRAGPGNLRIARPLQRRRRGGHRLRGCPDPQGGNRRRDGRFARRPSRPGS